MKLLRRYPFPTWRISSLRTEGKGGTEGVKTSTGKKEPSLTSASHHLREILQEIQRLRLEHEQASQPTPEKAQQNPTLLAELRLLR